MCSSDKRKKNTEHICNFLKGLADLKSECTLFIQMKQKKIVLFKKNNMSLYKKLEAVQVDIQISVSILKFRF